MLCVLSVFMGMNAAWAEQVPLTILHTNDIHSHFNPDKGPFKLGGMARIATTVRRVRESVKHSLLLDGGDWSEGHIYYNLDAGRTAVELMNTLGYDAAVVGNHDWLNGPDHMISLFNHTPPKFALLGANLGFSKYARAAELERFIQPYQILKVGPLKVGVIGLVTYELIYDKWLNPVEIQEPFATARKLAAKLKNEDGVDLVIVISHNGLGTNKLVAGTPNVDVVIHAHDHDRHAQPIPVERNGKKAVIVEAGHWGFYVGRLDLTVDTKTKKYTVRGYQLIQQDETIPDDPTVATMLRNYDRQLEQKYGNIFNDHVAESKIEVRRGPNESLWGNLVTDAYRDFTGADVSFEQMSLTTGHIHEGPLHSVDFFNALSLIWNPTTDQSWTLRTMNMTGATLKWVMNLVMSLVSYIPAGKIHVSGMHAVYDPMKLNKVDSLVDASGRFRLTENDLNSLGLLAEPAGQPVKSLEIGGKPVDPKKQYLVALPGGVYETLLFLEDVLGNKIERTNVRDTGVDDWRVLATYVKKNSPLTSAHIGRGGRFSPLQEDLALYHDELAIRRDGRRVEATVTVRNLGETTSAERKLKFYYDQTPSNTVDDPNVGAEEDTATIPAIGAGKMAQVNVALTLPASLSEVKVPLYFIVENEGDDPVTSNDRTWTLVDKNGGTSFDENHRIRVPEHAAHSH